MATSCAELFRPELCEHTVDAGASGAVAAGNSDLTDEHYAAAAFDNGESLHNTLAHILEAQQVWRLRCQHGISLSELVAGENIPSLAALCEVWLEEGDAMNMHYLFG